MLSSVVKKNLTQNPVLLPPQAYFNLRCLSGAFQGRKCENEKLASRRFSSSARVKEKVSLVLEDSTILRGESFGAKEPASGEVVFSTAMVGYPESLTDPSYKGQILVLTQPLIGNYGVPSTVHEDKYGLKAFVESDKVQVAGLVVSNYSKEYSHWNAVKSLGKWLEENNVPGIYGVDTRELTKRCRERGSMLGKIERNASSVGVEDPNKVNLVESVSRKNIDVYNPNGDVSIVAVDCGIKNNIIRSLADAGAKVMVVPWDYDFTSLPYDGLFLSNGPGNPKLASSLIENVKKAIAEDRPIFGICMGNQILAIAAGMDIYKMKYGNRGHNQPAINALTGECVITSQNHGYAVNDSPLVADWDIWFKNANDGTNEGLIHKTKPFMSVQFHPEATGGPLDSIDVFHKYVDMVRTRKAKHVIDHMTMAREFLHRFSSTRALNPSKKILMLGSGGLQIGQAGEFDYSGSQAIKALKEEGVETILLNPNIATIQTEKNLADTVYFLPLSPSYVEHIIKKEKPDGVMLAFGGQIALNTGVQCEDMGIFEEHGVSVLGTPISTLKTSEDRDLFAKALESIDEPVARSKAVNSVADALDAAASIGYPVIVRAAFCLGGLGSGFANSPSELSELASKSLSLSPQLLIERSLKGWKEVEYEVIRDSADNCNVICNMENFDPLGVHTGDSIVVAPSQTLSDQEYHMLRTSSIKIVRHMGVVGECNVQYALSPDSTEYKVIEMNARLSRSSALASKATGYPLAFVAAKLGLGYNLPDLVNNITKTTTACFEPSLDYIVCKIPRWDLDKFSYVSPNIGSAMKSVGEVMAIGRTFEESFQKALRMVDSSNIGFYPKESAVDYEILDNPTDKRVWALAKALFSKDMSVDELHDISKIDKWFLHKLQNISDLCGSLKGEKMSSISFEQMKEVKQAGFSDQMIGLVTSENEWDVREKRKALGIVPKVKQIDTLAAEFPARTNYLYTTYNAEYDDVNFDIKPSMVLGSGVYRIGSSVEFDWCGVSAIRALSAMGHKTVMVNYNPETVSTDYDECDRLYFEELSAERVMDIYEKENASGIITSMGGQLSQNIANPLYDHGARIFGTHPRNVDRAEDRFKFSKMLDEMGIDQPAWKELSTLEEAEKFCKTVGFPCLIRPSYVLSGAAMKVAHNMQELTDYLERATAVSPDHPVVISKFIKDAEEIDFDGVAQNGKLILHAISEHLENAGTHSGDASLVLPSRKITSVTKGEIKSIAEKVANSLQICGPFNMQIIHKDGQLKVIECNLRASRSFPFVSKALGVNFIERAVQSMFNENAVPVDLMQKDYKYQCVKVPQFSFTRLVGADPMTGVEMASTGEVACFGSDKYQAYWRALKSTHGFNVPKNGILLYGDLHTSEEDLYEIARKLSSQGFKIYSTPGTSFALLNNDVYSKSIKLDKQGLNELRSKFITKEIDLVVDVTGKKADSDAEIHYRIRRMAVDHGVALLNNAKCGLVFAEALKYEKSEFLSEPLSWSDYVFGEKMDSGSCHASGNM
eukprot:Nk52_evm41s2209 gene=Nk52_evmTU41s2209